MNCPNCGFSLPNDSSFCPYCGATISRTASSVPTPPLSASSAQNTLQSPPVKQRKRFCGNCGGVLDETGRCTSCGKQYLHLRSHKSKGPQLFLWIAAALLLMVGIVQCLLAFMPSSEKDGLIQELTSKDLLLEDRKKTLAAMQTQANAVTDEEAQLSVVYNFYDKYVVFIPERDYSLRFKFYHRINCLDPLDCIPVSTRYAIDNGYTMCPDCCMTDTQRKAHFKSEQTFIDDISEFE